MQTEVIREASYDAEHVASVVLNSLRQTDRLNQPLPQKRSMSIVANRVFSSYVSHNHLGNTLKQPTSPLIPPKYQNPPSLTFDEASAVFGGSRKPSGLITPTSVGGGLTPSLSRKPLMVSFRDKSNSGLSQVSKMGGSEVYTKPGSGVYSKVGSAVYSKPGSGVYSVKSGSGLLLSSTTSLNLTGEPRNALNHKRLSRAGGSNRISQGSTKSLGRLLHSSSRSGMFTLVAPAQLERLWWWSTAPPSILPELLAATQLSKEELSVVLRESYPCSLGMHPQDTVLVSLPRGGHTVVLEALDSLYFPGAKGPLSLRVNVRKLHQTFDPFFVPAQGKVVFVVRNPWVQRKSWNTLVSSVFSHFGGDLAQEENLEEDEEEQYLAHVLQHIHQLNVLVIVHELWVQFPEQLRAVLQNFCQGSTGGIDFSKVHTNSLLEDECEVWDKWVKPVEPYEFPSYSAFAEHVLSLYRDRFAVGKAVVAKTGSVPNFFAVNQAQGWATVQFEESSPRATSSNSSTPTAPQRKASFFRSRKNKEADSAAVVVVGGKQVTFVDQPSTSFFTRAPVENPPTPTRKSSLFGRKAFSAQQQEQTPPPTLARRASYFNRLSHSSRSGSPTNPKEEEAQQQLVKPTRSVNALIRFFESNSKQ